MTAAAAVRQSRIFVVGAGVVGKATGEGFLAAGHDVTFVDISPSRVAQLRRLGLDAREELVLDGEPPSFVFLTLPTPNDGHRYDLSALESGTAAVGVAVGATGTPHAGSDSGHSVVGTHTIVVRSTVPPGTTDGLVKGTLDAASGRTVGAGFALASNPEFLRAACAAEDFRHPWMTVVASRSARTVERLAGLLRPFGGELRTFADPAAAELLKCAHNIFNATKISFWNEMWLVARELGLDLDGIASVVARLEDVSISHSTGDGLVLENDSGTRLNGVTSTDNGHDGARLGFGPDHRTLQGVSTSGNQDYGVVAVGMAGLTVLGFASRQDVAGGIRLSQCTRSSVVDSTTSGDRIGVRVDAESHGTTITGGKLTGGDTGAAVSISGTAISGASLGLHAAAGVEVHADHVSIKALRTGARVEDGGGLVLSDSTVLAPVGIKGRVVYSGHNTVALPPFPRLGIVAIAAVVLGLLLEAVHALRQAGRIPTRATAPDHVLNTA